MTRDELAVESAEFAININDRRFRSFHIDGFISGWDAANEQIGIQWGLDAEYAKSCIEDYDKLDAERVKLRAENKRLREALEHIATNVDDIESYEVARQALALKADGRE